VPELPRITITNQEHYDRVVSTFPGATQTDKADAYRKWVVNNLIDRVELFERRQIELEQEAERRARLIALQESLPPRTPLVE
jgi:hypothetical protein